MGVSPPFREEGLEQLGALVSQDAAGDLAAALSIASGLLLLIASSVAHDVYYKLLRPDDPEAQRVRVGTVPAMRGMVTGIRFTASYILGNLDFGVSRWCFGIGPQGIGAVGMLHHFGGALLLTPWCKPPSNAGQRMVERMREPEGAGPALEIESASEQ